MTVSTHASGLNSVERELTALHRSMLTAGGRAGGVVRLSVLTLVAVCSNQEAADLAEVAVRHIAMAHPARAIIIVADPGSGHSLEADLALVAGADGDGRICAEQVRLTAGGETAQHVASLVTPLVLPDVPVFVWMVGPASLEGSFEGDAMALGAPVIIDSGSSAVASEGLAAVVGALDRNPDLVLADVAWTRCRGWRRHVAQAFNGAQARPFIRSITRIEVECAGREPSAQAWLMGGWLAGRLGRPGTNVPAVVVAATADGDASDGELRVLRLFATSAAHRATISVWVAEGRIHTRVDVDGSAVEDRAVPFTRPDVVRVVGSLLEQPPEDPIYEASVRQAVRLASATP